MEFQLSCFKSWKKMLWKCCTQYASKFGKLSSGHRTGKGVPTYLPINVHICVKLYTVSQPHSYQDFDESSLVPIPSQHPLFSFCLHLRCCAFLYQLFKIENLSTVLPLYSSLLTLLYIMSKKHWMGPSQGLRLKWEIRGRACTWNPVLPTLPLLRMPHKSLCLILILFLCLLMEWICNWNKSHKIIKHVSNLKMLSLSHFILVFKDHKQDDLPSEGSSQTCVMLCYYLCSLSPAMPHADIPLRNDTCFSYTICLGGSNQRLGDKGGCPSL